MELLSLEGLFECVKPALNVECLEGANLWLDLDRPFLIKLTDENCSLA